ncbi:16S rRNA (adenine(1518)-N(6)/adenine(1519)-N(6))-dimethyltransferase RsmA [Halanaerobium salsuginis]|uniref:Ribosomal RNA small subunit methyltransferase A n=1 Tax=Halanaerobium salsuginis TaxID=29563 RepID=A0A1I4I9E5_9FIRM|nr:16S rRNA (adenine(1518)-N(6)/adenine(1519)-N(6))-dimethyltransferase RsmA [Halanaerobium salsuginis]SFL50381.1 dimethyladenosine transferase [Halanaerobium salsuginis]
MGNKIASPSLTKEILNRYQLNLKKGLGQNFLVDSNIINIISQTAQIKGDELLIEIGPGIGALTQSLLGELDQSGHLLAIEKDSTMFAALQDIFNDETKLTLLNEDALKIDWPELVADYQKSDTSVKIIANLPYYITTPIIMSILESELKIDKLVFMVQKEVGERICAGPGTKKFGSLSVAVQYYLEPEIIHHVPAEVFIPQPDVDSVIVSLSPYSVNKYQNQVQDKNLFFKIVKSIFQQRRKTLRNSLSKSAVIALERELVTAALKAENIDLKKRGEKLTITEMISLSNRILQLQDRKEEKDD